MDNTNQPQNQTSASTPAPTEEEIKAEADRIRAEVVQAKADHISADSAEADKIRQDVENIKKAAEQLSPDAFSDLQATENHVETIS